MPSRSSSGDQELGCTRVEAQRERRRSAPRPSLSACVMRAHAVDQGAAGSRRGGRLPRPARPGVSGSRLGRVDVDAPPRIGPPAEHAEARTRRIDQHAIEARRRGTGRDAVGGDDRGTGCRAGRVGDHQAATRCSASIGGDHRGPDGGDAAWPCRRARHTGRGPGRRAAAPTAVDHGLRRRVLDVAVVAGVGRGRPVHGSRGRAWPAPGPRVASSSPTIQSG